jgi:hypothetical protein
MERADPGLSFNAYRGRSRPKEGFLVLSLPLSSIDIEKSLVSHLTVNCHFSSFLFF